MLLVYFFKEEAADEMRISEWSSGVCSSDVRKGIVQHLFETPSLCPRRRRLLSLDAIETSEQAATEKRAPGRILEPSKVRDGHLDIDLLADLLVARAREDHAEDLLAGHAMKRGGDAGGVLDHDTPLPRQTGKTRGKCIGLRPASSTDEAQRRGVDRKSRQVRLRGRRSARRQVRDDFPAQGD